MQLSNWQVAKETDSQLFSSYKRSRWSSLIRSSKRETWICWIQISFFPFCSHRPVLTTGSWEIHNQLLSCYSFQDGTEHQILIAVNYKAAETWKKMQLRFWEMLWVHYNHVDIRCNSLQVQKSTDSGNFLMGIFPIVFDVSKCLWR